MRPDPTSTPRFLLFRLLRWLLVSLTGHGYDRSPALNTLHHKLSYRLHKLLPFFGVTGVQQVTTRELGGKHLYVRAEDGGVGHQFLMYRQYEPYETTIVLRAVQPGDTVWNIGANLGYYVLITAGRVGKHGRVLAFEPAPANCELLTRTIEESGYTNIALHAAALGDTEGEAELALSSTNSGDHQLFALPDRRTVTVPIATVDLLVASGETSPDIIILDVQGAELDVLRGMTKVILDRAPRAIITEFWPAGLNARHSDGAREFLTRLFEAGYRFFDIDERRRTLAPMSIEELLSRTPGNTERNLLCTRS